jgi:signal transduction histidine kinase
MNSDVLKNQVAYLTWAVVSVCALYVQASLNGLHLLFWISLALQLVIGGGIVLTVQPRATTGGSSLRYLGLVLQGLAAIALNFTMMESFLTIYTIVLAGQLPSFLSLRPALLSVGLVMGSYFCIWHFYWQSGAALVETLLWTTFHLFSLLITFSLNREQSQKEHAIAVNQELKGTQTLLQEAAKQDERLRISRDLHDRLGHQLTALSIQLDVLRRSCPSPQREQAEVSYSLAQDLLKSIRNTVSDLRDDNAVDVAVALKTLIEGLPGLSLELDWPTDIEIDSLQQAQAVFSCVCEAATNTLKHAHATVLQIKARSQREQLDVWIQDNGRCSHVITAGNGLRGMAERMDNINGQFDWQVTNSTLVLHLRLPLAAAS